MFLCFSVQIYTVPQTETSTYANIFYVPHVPASPGLGVCDPWWRDLQSHQALGLYQGNTDSGGGASAREKARGWVDGHCLQSWLHCRNDTPQGPQGLTGKIWQDVWNCFSECLDWYLCKAANWILFNEFFKVPEGFLDESTQKNHFIEPTR